MSIKPSELVRIEGYDSIKHLSKLSGIPYDSLRKWPRKKPEAFLALIEKNKHKLEANKND